MSNWVDPSRANWSFTRNKIFGLGEGIGMHRISYAIDVAAARVLNGVVEADFTFPASDRGYAAGLVCRSDREWTFLAGYVLNNPMRPHGALVIGTCENGTFVPVHASELPFTLEPSTHHLALEFVSGKIEIRVLNDKKQFQTEAIIPHLPFPGHVGLVKLYDTEVLVRNFDFRPLLKPFERLARPMYKYDVFISHSSRDKPIVESVAARLRNAGVKYWLDSEQIHVGDSIIQKIEDGIMNSRHVLVCLSSNLKKSNWSRAEYGVILHKYFGGITNRRVLPLLLDRVADDDIPPLLYDIHRSDYSKKADFENLLAYLRS